MDALIAWGNEAMPWIVQQRGPILTPIFKFFTLLGQETALIVLTAIGYWLWRKDTFARLGIVMMVSGILLATIKGVVREPRPMLEPLAAARGWSFPSGHAQYAGAIWGWLAYEVGKPWFMGLCAFVMVMIAASRPYLGVHYPHDVIAGLLIGLATVVIFAWLVKREPRLWRTMAPWGQACVVLLLEAVWLLAVRVDDPEEIILKSAGGLLGFWFGVALERHNLDFARPTRPLQAVASVVIGLSGMLALWFGGSAVVKLGGPTAPLAQYLLYALIGFWIAFAAPWVTQQATGRWPDAT